MMSTLRLEIETRPTLSAGDRNVLDINIVNGIKLDIINSKVGDKIWSTSVLQLRIMIDINSAVGDDNMIKVNSVSGSRNGRRHQLLIGAKE